MQIIRVVDLETTGFEPPEAAICEVAYTDVMSRRFDLIERPTDWEPFSDFASFVKPPHPIPPVTSAVHHIIDEDVDGAPLWEEVWPRMIQCAPEVGKIIAYAAHSAKFERKFITENMTQGAPWICTYKCALRLWPDAPGHSNQALRYWLRPPGLDRQKALVAHRAGPDTYVTAFLLMEMLKLAEMDALVQWSTEPALLVRCHFGQHRGTKWTDVDEGFLNWVRVRDFDEDVLFTVEHELKRRREEYERERSRVPEDGPPF